MPEETAWCASEAWPQSCRLGAMALAPMKERLQEDVLVMLWLCAGYVLPMIGLCVAYVWAMFWIVWDGFIMFFARNGPR